MATAPLQLPKTSKLGDSTREEMITELYDAIYNINVTKLRELIDRHPELLRFVKSKEEV